jgi:toxin CptA
VSSPSDRFECRWQASRLLLTVYLAALSLALFAVSQLDISGAAIGFGVLLCAVHALWTLPRTILLARPSAFHGLRRDADGWQIWSEQGGWQTIQVCGDTVVLPLIVILRFRVQTAGRLERQVRSLCIPRDALAPDIHRRLRVRLKFSRRGLAGSE